MAVGFTGADGHLETIQATIDNGIDFARSQLPCGESLEYCLECDNPIPIARQKALLGVKYCVQCQSLRDGAYKEYYNRRGSKDSQLR